MPDSISIARKDWAASWWFLAGLLVLVAIGFAPVVDFGWGFDDRHQIVENPNLETWDGLRRGLTAELWSFSQDAGDGKRLTYRPLFAWYLTLGRQVFGVNPAGWHVVSLVLHMLATVVVWRLAMALGLGGLALGLGTVLFAVHPVQIQAVAWVSATSDPMQMIALGLCLLAWLRALEQGSMKWAGLAALGLAAGVLTIERAYPFAGVIALAALVWPGGTSWPRLWSRIRLASPLVVAVVITIGMRLAATGSAAKGTGVVSGVEALLTAPSLALEYARNLALPVFLSLGYPVGITSGLSLVGVVLPAVLGLVALGGAAWLSRHSPRRQLLLGSALLLMLPALHAGILLPDLLVQDRYLYVPSAFLFLWIGDCVAAAPRAVKAAVGLWVLLLLAMHRPNLWPWQDPLALYTRANEVTPGHPTLAMNLSNERRRRGLGDPDCALLQAARDRMAEPQWRGTTVILDYNLGNCWRDQGDRNRAIEHYRRSARDSSHRFFRSLHNLASLQLDAGDLTGAAATLELMKEHHPHRPRTWQLAGLLAAQQDDFDGARSAFERALELDPSFAPAKQMLARLPSG